MGLLETRSIKQIYDRLYDDISKYIFGNRLLYSFTGDHSYIRSIVESTHSGEKIQRVTDKFKRFILFGGGIWGGNILWGYQDLNWQYAWDNNPKSDTIRSRNKEFSDKEIAIDLRKYNSEERIDKDTAVVISSRLYHKEIYEQLINNGIDKDQIINVGKEIDDMSKRQYFDLPFLVKNPDEVFVDAGAFDGETSVQFDHYYEGQYSEIYAFEPDKSNIQKFRKKIGDSSCHDITLIQHGLWSERSFLSFQSVSNGSSTITQNGTQTIKVDKLDNMMDISKKVSFIKMDLEGAEYNALLGAQRIIKTFQPKLAISIYHKPEDIWELPELILSYNPDYKLYLRHYSLAASETVLYAI